MLAADSGLGLVRFAESLVLGAVAVCLGADDCVP